MVSTLLKNSAALSFNTPQPAKKLLRNKHKLPENVIIFSDQTPSQQKYLSKLKEDLATRKNKGENDITIKYINGTPTIIKTPKNTMGTIKVNSEANT